MSELRSAIYKKKTMAGRVRLAQAISPDEEVLVCKCPTAQEFTVFWGLDIDGGEDMINQVVARESPVELDRGRGLMGLRGVRPSLSQRPSLVSLATGSSASCSSVSTSTRGSLGGTPGFHTPAPRRKSATVHFVDCPSPLEDDAIDALILKLLVSQDRFGVYSLLENVLEIPMDLIPTPVRPKRKLSRDEFGRQLSRRLRKLPIESDELKGCKSRTRGLRRANSEVSLVEFIERLEPRQLNRSRADWSLYSTHRIAKGAEFIDGKEAQWLSFGECLVNGLKWLTS